MLCVAARGLDGGGGLETAGVTLAINEMLLQSAGGRLRFFPVWPTARPAAFTTLRAVGGFLVSATFTPGASGGQVGADITSTVGGDCVVHSAAAGGVPPAVVDAKTGSIVPVSSRTSGPNDFGFGTDAGGTYRLTMSLQ